MIPERLRYEIPELRSAAVSIAPLAGGLTNESWLLTGDFGRWVLRANRPAPGVDRRREDLVLRAIAQAPWSPRVVRNAPQAGYLVTLFEAEPPWTAARAVTAPAQATLGAWLAELHVAGAPAVPEIDVAGTLALYLEKVRGPERARLDAQAARVLAAWEGIARGGSRVLCHLDLTAPNVLGTGRVATVIDWEFAGLADPALDLALFMHYQGLDLHRASPLLEAYGADGDLRERIATALDVAALLDETWRLAAGSPAPVPSS